LKGKHDLFTIFGYFTGKRDISSDFVYSKMLTNKTTKTPKKRLLLWIFKKKGDEKLFFFPYWPYENGL